MNSLNLALLDLGSVSRPTQATSKREPKGEDGSTTPAPFSSLLSDRLAAKSAKLAEDKDTSKPDDDTKILKDKLPLVVTDKLTNSLEQSLAPSFLNLDTINKFQPTVAKELVSSLMPNNPFLGPKPVITLATDIINMLPMVPKIAVNNAQTNITPLVTNDETQLTSQLDNEYIDNEIKPEAQPYAEPLTLLNLAVAKHILPNIVSNPKMLNAELKESSQEVVKEDTKVALAVTTPQPEAVATTSSGEGSLLSSQIAALESITNQNLKQDKLTVKVTSSEKPASINSLFTNIIEPAESTIVPPPTNVVALKLQDILVSRESETKQNTQLDQTSQNELGEVDTENSNATSLTNNHEPNGFISMLNSPLVQTELAPEANSKPALTNAPLQVLEHIEKEWSHNSETDMRLHISLKPERLGQVEVEIVRATSGEWDVRMVAQSQTTHQVLSHEIDNLRMHLEQIGLHISQLAVSTNLGQDSQPSQQQQSSSYQVYPDLSVNETEVTTEVNESERLLNIRI